MESIKRLIAYYLMTVMVYPWHVMAETTIPSGETNTQVYTTNTSVGSVPVVNIAAPNASGLSHNKFNQYNVGTNGLILNNATSDTRSLLGGMIRENANLNGRSANIILNEVTAANPSKLLGYQEVNGRAAELVIANPNGITCNGCGFINTPRVTLSTGVPLLGSNGQLLGFNVTQGAITIQDYLDAQNVTAFDLVTRSLLVEGDIYAKDLGVYLGANFFDYANKTLAPLALDGKRGLDSVFLGGMYADRIRLVANDAGVGVRMLGDVATRVGDIDISAAGKITLANKMSAKGNLNVTYTGSILNNTSTNGGPLSPSENASIILLKDAKGSTAPSLFAGKGLRLSAGNSDLFIENVDIGAAENVVLSGRSLRDIGSDAVARYAINGSIDANFTNDVSLNAAAFDASKGLTMRAQNASLGSAYLLNRSATGAITLLLPNALDLGNATLQSSGAMAITAKQITTTLNSTTTSPILLANKSIEIHLADDSRLTGEVRSNQNVSIALDGTGDLTNHALIYAKDNVSITSVEDFSNQDTIVADKLLNIVAEEQTNSGTLQGGNVYLGGQTFKNTKTGLVISDADKGLSASTAQAAVTVDMLGSVDNFGQLYGADGLSVTGKFIYNAGEMFSDKLLKIDAVSRELSLIATSFINRGKIIGHMVDIDARSAQLARGLIAATSTFVPNPAYTSTSPSTVPQFIESVKGSITLDTTGFLTLMGTRLDSTGDLLINTNFFLDNSLAADIVRGAPEEQPTTDYGSSQIRHAGRDLSVTVNGGNFVATREQTWDADRDLSIQAQIIRLDSPDLVTLSAGRDIQLTSSGSTFPIEKIQINANASVLANRNITFNTDKSNFTVNVANNSSTLPADQRASGIQAGGKIIFNLGNQLQVNGTLVSGGGIDVLFDKDATNKTLNLTGQIRTGGIFTFKDSIGARAGAINLGADSLLFADGFDILADTIDIGRRESFSGNAFGRFVGGNARGSKINLDRLAIDSDYIDFVLNSSASAETDLILGSNFINSGFLYAFGDVNVRTNFNVTNRASGAIVGGAGQFNFHLDSNNTTFANYGTMHAGLGGMSVLLNVTGQKIYNYSQISGENILLGQRLEYGNEIYNYGSIKGNNITIWASIFRNEPLSKGIIVNSQNTFTSGRNYRYFENAYNVFRGCTDFTRPECSVENIYPFGSLREVGRTSDNQPIYKFYDDIFTSNEYISYGLRSEKGPWGNTNESNPCSGSAGKDTASGYCSGYNLAGTPYVFMDYRYNKTVEDVFLERPSAAPTIEANGTLSISTSDGSNHGGEITGNIVQLNKFVTFRDQRSNTAAPPATFTNQAITLTRTDSEIEGRTRYTCRVASFETCGDLSFVDVNSARNQDERVANSNTYFSFSQGGLIKANTLMGDISNLVNKTSNAVSVSIGNPDNPSTVDTSLNVASVLNIGNVASSSRPSSLLEGLNLSLPSGRNNLFVTAQSTDSRFLVESNPLFISNLNPSLGSDYLARQLGLNPDNLLLRLGDNAYENFLIKEQIKKLTGTSLIRSAYSDDEQLSTLYDGSTTEAKRMNLSFGVALTEAQVKDLKQDMVWMVEQEVQGKKVLVPVVYLTDATRIATQGKGDTRILARDIVIKNDSFTNQAATVEADNNLVIQSRNNIKNISGDIRGGNVFLKSEKGSIINETLTYREGDDQNFETKLARRGSIYASKVLVAEAGESIDLIGANMSGKEGVYLNASRINATALVLDSRKTTSYEYKTPITYEKVDNRYDTQQAAGSVISSSNGNVVIKGNQAVNIIGSSVNAAQNAVLMTNPGGKVTVKAQELNSSWSESSERTGLFNNVSIEKGRRATKDQEGITAAAGMFSGIENSKSSSMGRAKDFAASSINGGEATVIIADQGTVDIVGSRINSGAGGTLIKAKDVNVLATQSERQESYKQENHRVGVFAEINPDGASVGVKTKGSTLEGQETSSRANVSNIRSEGNVTILADNLTNQGTSITGDSIYVKAKEVKNLAAINTSSKQEKGTSYEVGISADATLNGMGQSISDLANGEKDANLVIASPETRLKLGGSGSEYETTTRSSEAVVTRFNARGDASQGGGNVIFDVDGKLLDEGTRYSANNNIVIDAKDYENKAVANTRFEQTKSTNADATLTVGMNTMSEATGTLSANGGRSEKSSETSQAVVGGFSAGNNVVIRAKNNIELEGTNINAGEDVYLKAGNKLTIKQANNTSKFSEKSEKGGATVSASACADLTCASASVGGNGRVANLQEESREGVASNITAGGNVALISKEKLTLQGTNIDAGKNVALVSTASKVDYQALSSEYKAKGSVSGGGTTVGGSVGKSAKTFDSGGANTSVQFESGVTDKESQMRTGGTVKAGGNFTLNSAEKSNFEGTDISADTATIIGKGVVFQSAQSTEKDNSYSVKGDVSAGGGIGAGTGDGQGGSMSGSSKSFNFSAGVKQSASEKDNLTNDNFRLNTQNGTTFDVDGDVEMRGAVIGGKVGGTITGNVIQETRTDRIKESSSSNNIYAGLSEVNIEDKQKGPKQPTSTGDKINNGQGKILNAAGHLGATGLYVNSKSSSKDSVTASERTGFTGDASGLTIGGNLTMVGAAEPQVKANVLGTTTSQDIQTYSKSTSSSSVFAGTVASALGKDQGKSIEVNGNLFKAPSGGGKKPSAGNGGDDTPSINKPKLPVDNDAGYTRRPRVDSDAGDAFPDTGKPGLNKNPNGIDIPADGVVRGKVVGNVNSFDGDVSPPSNDGPTRPRPSVSEEGAFPDTGKTGLNKNPNGIDIPADGVVRGKIVGNVDRFDGDASSPSKDGPTRPRPPVSEEGAFPDTGKPGLNKNPNGIDIPADGVVRGKIVGNVDRFDGDASSPSNDGPTRPRPPVSEDGAFPDTGKAIDKVSTLGRIDKDAYTSATDSNTRARASSEEDGAFATLETSGTNSRLALAEPDGKITQNRRSVSVEAELAKRKEGYADVGDLYLADTDQPIKNDNPSGLYLTEDTRYQQKKDSDADEPYAVLDYGSQEQASDTQNYDAPTYKKDDTLPVSKEPNLKPVDQRIIGQAELLDKQGQKYVLDVVKLDDSFVGENIGASEYWGKAGQITYYGDADRRAMELTINKDGLLVYKQNPEKRFSTVGAEDGAIFVMTPDGKMYAHTAPVRGQIHHSSLAAGEPVVMAGHLVAVDGKLKHIDNWSGHYAVDANRFKKARDYLANQGLDMSDTRNVGLGSQWVMVNGKLKMNGSGWIDLDTNQKIRNPRAEIISTLGIGKQDKPESSGASYEPQPYGGRASTYQAPDYPPQRNQGGQEGIGGAPIKNDAPRLKNEYDIEANGYQTDNSQKYEAVDSYKDVTQLE